MQAFLIDPFLKTVQAIDYNGNWETIGPAIDCDLFDIARFDDNGDGVFVDNEGLFKENQAFFVIDGYPSPLAGKGLVLGCDENGEATAPTVSHADLLKKVQWMREVYLYSWANGL
jgi:hypothetical protein